MHGFWIIALIFGTFLFMEFVAWFTHKYVMHGLLWVLHKDHHTPDHQKLEKNDFFALIFAIPSVFFIFIGHFRSIPFSLWAGVGIALYGIAYFLYHDVLIHKRLSIFGEPKGWYFKAVVRAHIDHHTKGKNYGFLFMVPLRYFNQELKQRKKY